MKGSELKTLPVKQKKTGLNERIHPNRCSRFCNGQSTQEPQGSTGLGEKAVSYSIDTTYFHQISTDLHERCDLFWDRWSYLHNLHQLSRLQKQPFGESVSFWGFIWDSVRSSPSFAFGKRAGSPQQSLPRQDLGTCSSHLSGFST